MLLVAYEWSKSGDFAKLENRLTEFPPALQEDVQRFYENLEARLDEVGYFFPHEKRESMTRNLRTAFSRAEFTEGEIRILHGVVKALAKRK